MNVLADEQQKLYQEGLTEEEYKKIEKEFLELYYKMRDKNASKFYSKLTLEQRKKIHKYILGIYILKNRLGGLTHEIIADRRQKTDRPIIFAVTHVGKFDIEVTSEAIKDHYYLLSGDYEHIQGIIDEPFIGLNGIFYFNEFVKSERQEVTDKMINHLQQNGNLMYFIEGTWNMTPNLPMLPCYWGIVDIAKKGNAIIVPVAADQYGKHFKINIGENFDMNNYGSDASEKTRAITDLRDTLATLKWEIWETEPTKRKDIAPDEWDKYVEERFKEWPYFSLEYIDRLVFKPKNVVERKDVYAFAKKLTPNKNNAFLYDKRNIDGIFREN
ncbi:MAG: 1-acyl-sn-glycerol-3-phosphate acyltransferase [Erysipelotrichales bacterium]|nr:1-acyl-sn-glycerol-3-phosphate acyltransferase [Erysipelotrichales bacterium]